jgi:hypothetical protein
MDEHAQKHDERSDENYGSGDPVLPYVIVGALVTIGLIAMHTVGHKAMSVGTTLAFIFDGFWFFGGVFFLLIWPIIIWVPMDRKHKWSKMFLSIIVGIVYFTASGMLMAALPRMN